jgi:hypothetical protein
MRKLRLGLIVLFVIPFVASPTFGQQEKSPAGTQPGAASLPDLTPDANGNLSQAQMRQLARAVMENYRANSKKEREYSYIDHGVENKLDGAGEIKSTESKTSEIMELYGEQVRRLIAKDEKPLSVKDAAKEEEKIQKLTEKRKHESEEERANQQQEEEKQREKNSEFVREVADAYDFHLEGTEILNGRDTWVVRGEPKRGFVAHLKDAEILSKYRGRLWIDKNDLQVAKMDAEAIDTVSFGWFLLRIHKGTRLVIERTRVNDEVWLPQHISFKFDARVALFKGYNEEDEDTYTDYKKFRATTRIVDLGDGNPK